MAVKTATCRAEFKALPADDGSPSGVFEALVSVFGNVDFDGDRVVKGAFVDTLAAWAAKGDPIPVIWSHQWNDPMAHIGVVTDARETEVGLWVKGLLDLDRPFAEQVYHLLAGRRVTQFSFSYDAVEFSWSQEPGQLGQIRELYKLDIWEVGPTLLGMNPDTALLGTASRPEPLPQKLPEPTPPAPRDGPATIAMEQRTAVLMTMTRHTNEE